MKVIYIIGPYRAATEAGVARNIVRARGLAETVWGLGHAALCPHLNTAFMGGLVSDEIFLAGGLLLLEKCDAAVCAPRWQSSTGSVAEMNHAAAKGIPVFDSVVDLVAWFKDTDRSKQRHGEEIGPRG